jgi:flagellar FliL protein
MPWHEHCKIQKENRCRRTKGKQEILSRRQRKLKVLKLKFSIKSLLIVLGAILLLGGGGGWFFLLSPWKVVDGPALVGMKKVSAGEKKPEKETRNFIYKMDPFIVNLSDSERMRYLKLKLEIESSEGKSNEEYEKRLPQLRDTVLSLLASKASKEIMDSDGKKKLRNEIASRLNQLLTTFQIETVYFAEFVIQ